MSTDSNRQRLKSKSIKPEKPRPDFPLFPHATGYWAKKVRGELKYFGSWRDDPKGQRALEQWAEQKDDLLAGRTPRAMRDGLTLIDLCNAFYRAKLHLLETGEITPRTFHDYRAVTDRLLAVFGKRRLVEDLAADDFETLRRNIAKTRGPVALGNEISRVRMVFKYAFEAGLIDKTVRCGPAFKKPSKKTLRKARAEAGSKMFEAPEIRALLERADGQLKAMVLLALNCGFGNSDIGNLPISAINLETGWIDFARPKTGVERRCPLWVETVKALRNVVASRPVPVDPADAGKVFLTKYGQSWAKVGDRESASSANPLSAEFRKLSVAVGVHKPGRSFYSLRHVFQTVGEEAGETATRFLMGHVDSSMSATYRERIADERLIAVTDHVRAWVWPKPAAKPEKKKPKAKALKPKPEPKPAQSSAKHIKPKADDTAPPLHLYVPEGAA